MKGLPALLSMALLSTISLHAWAAPQTALPFTKIVLYSSGVGYFQRDGHVEDRAEIALRFKSGDMNDLLKSMVVQDFDGGRVTAVTYDARDPLAKILKSFAVDLTAQPGLGTLLRQIRGEPLEVATPAPVRGLILGVEKKREKAGDRDVVEVAYLNLLTDDGLRAIPLSQVQRITLLNARLETELRQALEVLATSHDTRKKAVRLTFEGSGQRRVRVAYIVEMPVWKTTYRLVLSDTAKAFLQGWAIVENTTDEDWQQVQLSLISGRPLAFVMDLYEPLYVERPVVVPELYTALRPQVYEQAMEAARGELPKARPADARQEQEAPAERRQRLMGSTEAKRLNAPAATVAEERAALALQQGVTAAAEAAELGELFAYTISTPVSLGRQKSAMLPIVSAEVEGTKLSIYNERVHAKHPLNGLRVQNSTALHLMQGPITVFDRDSYAGDARIPDTPPGQEQLISYAVDLKTEVERVTTNESPELVTVSLRHGTLLVTRKAIAEKTYTVKNRDQKQKVVLIEHPFLPDWRLVTPDKPTARTREAYRFALTVEAGKTAQLRVREEKPLQQTVRLTDAGPDLLLYYIQAQQVSSEVKDALQKVAALRNRLEQTRDHVQRLEQRRQEIAQEQSRIRQNMMRLSQNSALYNRYVRKLDEQETEVERLHQEHESLKTTEARQEQELNDYLRGLDIE